MRSILRKAVADSQRAAGITPQTDIEDQLKAINDAIALKSLQNRALARSNSMPLTPEEIHALDRRSPVSTNDGSESERSLPATPEPVRKASGPTTRYEQLPQRRIKRKPRRFPGREDSPPRIAPAAVPEDDGEIMFVDDEEEEAAVAPSINGHAAAHEINGSTTKAMSQYDDIDNLIDEGDFNEDFMP
jgi:hypothetical protein